MIEYEPLDPTMLAVMEIYRRQVTDLKERLHHAEEARQYAEGNYEGERTRANHLHDRRKEAETRTENARATITERDTKITKLEGIIQSLKIELQDARAAAAKDDE